MEKINILFVIPQLERGGSETLVYELASRLDRKVFDVSLAYFDFYGNDEFRKTFVNQGVKLHHISLDGRSAYSTMLKMARIVQNNNIHVINAHHFFSMVYSFYACKITHRRGLAYTEHSGWEINGFSLKWKLIAGALMRQVDCAIGISDEVTKKLRAEFHLGSKKAFTIRNGVDLNDGTRTRDFRSIRNELGLVDNLKVITMVANFRKIKNHLLLLRGFKELLEEFNKVKLLLIGQGQINDPENSENEVRQFLVANDLLDKVILTGHRNDVKDILSITDIFCLTSLKEGLPIAMLEAMSSGLPVIGTDVPGIRDVIVHGENGFLVRVGDHMALKAAMVKLLTNEKLKCSYGQASRRIVEDSYSIRQCVGRYEDLFLRLMRGS